MAEFRITGVSDTPEEDSFDIVTCHPTARIGTVSDLIAALQKIISAHGDLPIIQECDGYATPIAGYCLVMQGGETKVMI